MPNRLPIPDELQHLLEKRSGEEQRATARRESSAEATDAETGTGEPPSEVEDDDRRSEGERRQQTRRDGDQVT